MLPMLVANVAFAVADGLMKDKYRRINENRTKMSIIKFAPKCSILAEFVKGQRQRSLFSP